MAGDLASYFSNNYTHTQSNMPITCALKQLILNLKHHASTNLKTILIYHEAQCTKYVDCSKKETKTSALHVRGIENI